MSPPVPLPPSADSTAALPALEAVALSCERGERALFRPLNFRLSAGQVVWLRGRNGRGKTTLLRAMAGLARPAAGAVHFGGQPLAAAGASWRAALVHLGHANALKEDLSVAECLRFFARLQGRWPTEADIANALALVGLPGLARRAVRTLSQGMRRRVALARLALAPRPSVWLLDEPFDALDDAGVAMLAGLIGRHAAAGGSVLYTSHLPVPHMDPAPTLLELDEHAAGPLHGVRGNA